MSATPQERREALPTGTVTFAFTDIEGSTARWERDRTAMQSAVRRHDELMRASIAAYGGVVFKTIGDAFCAAFARPEDAVAAMLDAQGAIADEDFSAVGELRVRAAIHTGTADERDGDYFGPAVNRVSRLLAIGHGGQVLVSSVTADLVQGELPSQTTLRDLGEHRLRDLARPEYVYQLVAPDLRAEFPPLRSLDVLPNNLPLQLRSFVGRETEIAEITSLIERHRLVTLVGSGGVGKTRTSLQVAANLLDGSGDGVWFIELAPLSSTDYIPSAVAKALGITLPHEGDPTENLIRTLKAKTALLVFDNCEHMIEHAARVISNVLRGCPHVRVLASSRQALGIVAEATFRMPSMSVPRGMGNSSLTAADWSQYAAISLFAERARAVDNRFGLSDENAPIVADICRRLDGIPLAIELAASRVKILSLHQLRERLDERFRILTGGSRDVLPRQQTLRALIDWSYDLLDERERVLFRRLGIFVNGFTLEGAVGVGSGDDLDDLDVFDVLATLADKSLVLAEPDGDSLRYRLLESTRAYASEKLDASDERLLVAERHLGYLRNRFAELWRVKERTARPTELVKAFAAELQDLRFALDDALRRSAIVEGAELLVYLQGAFWGLGLENEGVRRYEQYVSALPASEHRLLSLTSSNLSNYLRGIGQRIRAFQYATEAVGHARASGDSAALAIALRNLGSSATFCRRFEEAEAALAEAEAIGGQTENARIVSLENKAQLRLLRGDYEAAVRTFEQLRVLYRSLGNATGESAATVLLAEAEHASGHTHRAIEIVLGVLSGLRSVDDKSLLVNALENLGGYLIAAGDSSGAVSVAREAIHIMAEREPDHVYIGISVEHLALAYALRGELVRAAQQEGFADALLARSGYEREFTETATHARLMNVLRERLAPGELERLLAEGASLTSEAAIALACVDP